MTHSSLLPPSPGSEAVFDGERIFKSSCAAKGRERPISSSSLLASSIRRATFFSPSPVSSGVLPASHILLDVVCQCIVMNVFRSVFQRPLVAERFFILEQARRLFTIVSRMPVSPWRFP